MRSTKHFLPDTECLRVERVSKVVRNLHAISADEGGRKGISEARLLVNDFYNTFSLAVLTEGVFQVEGCLTMAPRGSNFCN